MPYQNRVNPYGEICFSTHRGGLMGNRGHLHNEHQKIIRNFQLKRWIICVLDFKERKRTIMQKGRYTELFFWDEATALAAGHRPCAECQRDKFNIFKSLWAKANDVETITTQQMDECIHGERTVRDKTVVRLADIPDGTFIEYDTQPFLKFKDKIYKWGFDGYKDGIHIGSEEPVLLLTPISIVKTISAGYLPQINF